MWTMARIEFPISIDSREEYDYLKGRSYSPLIDSRFQIPIDLRRKLQSQMFNSDVQFYVWMWDNWPRKWDTFPTCQECGIMLYQYYAWNISHIITRGSHPEMRYDARNINMLCKKDHNKWEFAPETKKRHMNIYPANQEIIKTLNHEYATHGIGVC